MSWAEIDYIHVYYISCENDFTERFVDTAVSVMNNIGTVVIIHIYLILMNDICMNIYRSLLRV